MIPAGDRDQALLERVAPALFDGCARMSLLGRLALSMHPQLARRALRFVTRHEGGVGRSRSLRQYLLQRDGVVLGAWSYISDLRVGALPPNTVIGRYASIGPNLVVANENHPLDRFSTSPWFYDPYAGLVHERVLPPRQTLAIGHDVWIGANACILPRVRSIGHGAVIGAGSVVTRCVPPLAIVAGNPARVVRSRFEGEEAKQWLASRWWRCAPREAMELCAEGVTHTETPRFDKQREESDRAFERMFDG